MNEYAAKLEDGMVVLVEIVRCRDCKWCESDICAYWCCRVKYNEFEIGSLDSEPDGFCAWGERKQ